MFEKINWDIIGSLATVITLFSPIIKYTALSASQRYRKEKSIIEKLNLELDSLLKNTEYMQYISTSESRLLKNIPFINISILLRKNINFENLIYVIHITNKKLCFYILETKTIRLVNKHRYKDLKRNDLKLHFYFYSTILLSLAFIYLLFQSFLVKIELFQIFSIKELLLGNSTQNFIAMIFLYITSLIFEVLWLNRKNPYDSYKTLVKLSRTSNSLARLNIEVPPYST